VNTYGQEKSGVRVTIEAPDIPCEVNRIVPIGLILNELLTNAFKHAFAGKDAGRIEVSVIDDEDDKLKLTVRDDGVVLPDTFGAENTGSVGTRIINLLVEQIEGRLEYRSDRQNGTEFQVLFSP